MRWKILFIFILISSTFIFADVVNDTSSEAYIFNFQILYTTFDGSTTDFYSYNETELSDVSNVVLEKTSYGKIEFNENLDILSMDGGDGIVDFDTDVTITDNIISVDEVDLPGINKSVTLSIYGLDFSDPIIYKNDVVCSTCSLISYSGGTLVFSDTVFEEVYYARDNLYCGDGTCNNGEDCESCPQDCGECEEPEPPPEPPPEPDPTQGGIYDFYLNPWFFSVDMEKGTYYRKTITVTNNGTANIALVVRIDPELSQFIFPDVRGFVLAPNATRDLVLDIYVSNREIADVYYGKISLVYGELIRSTEVALEVQEKDALFDIKTEMLKKYINPGGRARANVTILNMGDIRNFDVTLEYQMVDFDRNVYTIKSEDFAMNRTYRGEFYLDVPTDAPPGNYLFFTRVIYGDVNASSYDTFTVETISSIAWIVLLFIILVLIILIYIWYKYKKEEHRYKVKEKERKKKAEEAVSGKLKLPEKKKVEVPQLP